MIVQTSHLNIILITSMYLAYNGYQTNLTKRFTWAKCLVTTVFTYFDFVEIQDGVISLLTPAIVLGELLFHCVLFH